MTRFRHSPRSLAGNPWIPCQNPQGMTKKSLSPFSYASLQLRYLQTLADIANEKSSTIVFPLPIDLIAPLLRSVKD